MASSVNKVILVGNLGNDPEIRSFQSGGRIANFSIATSESWKDKQSGERKEKTQWHRIVVKNEHLVAICEKYLKKGSKVFLEGQLEHRKWKDGQGAEKYATEVVLNMFKGELTMLETKGSNGDGGEQHQEPVAHQHSQGSYAASSNNDMDDDIPF